MDKILVGNEKAKLFDPTLRMCFVIEMRDCKPARKEFLHFLIENEIVIGGGLLDTRAYCPSSNDEG